ncbi:response regulator [Dokdonia sp.]|uniref:response regulator n=1 Tax=Dokdonia sp. TaxID=2024995 RepID=UPI0032674978
MSDTNRMYIAHSNQNFVESLTSHFTDTHTLYNSTNDGFEALRYILKYNPKLVIIEADLPNLNATDIIKCINKKSRTTTFIVVTTNNSTKVPCTSKRKKIKAPPCFTQVIEIAYNQSNFTPILQLIDKADQKKQIIPY